jgi:hypothetical protein
MSQAAHGASEAGLEVLTGVSDENALDPSMLKIDSAAVRRSIRAELDTERRWRRLLAGGTEPWWQAGAFCLRRLVRTSRLAPPWGGTPEDGARMVRRLANIELSHLRLIDDAVASGARWALLLEDDAGSPDGVAFGGELAAFIAAVDSHEQPRMVSQSDSFTAEDLGIAALLLPVSPARGPWPMHSATRAVTNTVCATLYRHDFLEQLQRTLAAIPLDPVIPIDFKLNEALMRLAAGYQPGDAWLASPAPLAQRSGVPAVRFG